jgi:hypothetical protein
MAAKTYASINAGPACWAANPGNKKNPALKVVPAAIENTPRRPISFFNFFLAIIFIYNYRVSRIIIINLSFRTNVRNLSKVRDFSPTNRVGNDTHFI